MCRCNFRCRDNFHLGRSGRVVVISYGPLKTLVLVPENIQGISTDMVSSCNHKVMKTFLCSLLYLKWTLQHYNTISGKSWFNVF
jgi:hypothetical protein